MTKLQRRLRDRSSIIENFIREFSLYSITHSRCNLSFELIYVASLTPPVEGSRGTTRRLLNQYLLQVRRIVTPSNQHKLPRLLELDMLPGQSVNFITYCQIFCLMRLPR